MNRLTRFVLGHKRLVLGCLDRHHDRRLRRASGRRTTRSRSSSARPGSRPPRRTSSSASSTATAATSRRSCPSSSSRRARPSTRPASRSSSTPRSRGSRRSCRDSRTASYASTGDRAFVSKDGRTTFALVYIPAKGGVNPGWVEAQAAQAALADVTVGGSAVEVTGLDALRSSAGESEGSGTGVLVGTLLARARRAARPRPRLPLVHGARAAADGVRRDPDDVPADLAGRERHRRVADRPVPRRADRARHRDRLRAARRRPLARGAPAAGRRRTRRRCATRWQHAGSAVVFSGTTVAISLLALVVLPVPFLRSIGIAGLLIALVSVAVAVTLLPVLLATIGPKLDWPRDRREARASRRLVGLGALRRAPPLGRGRRVHRRARRPRGRRRLDPARQPARRLARATAGPARAGLEKLERRRASARVRSRRSTRSSAQATPAPSRRRSPRSTASRARSHPRTGAAARRRSSPSSRPQDGNSAAGRATLDRIRAATLPAS